MTSSVPEEQYMPEPTDQIITEEGQLYPGPVEETASQLNILLLGVETEMDLYQEIFKPDKETETFYNTMEPGPSEHFEPKPYQYKEPEPESDSDDEVATTNGKRGLALAKLTPFNRDRTRIKVFLQECYLYLEVNKDVYDTSVTPPWVALSSTNSWVWHC